MSVYVGFRGDLRYGKEASFKGGTQADLVNRFGLGQRPTRVDVAREYDVVRELGDRRLQAIIGRRERHRIGVEFILSRPEELGIILQQQTDPTTGAITGYAYKEIPDSFAVGLLLGDTAGGEALLLFKGAVPASFTLSLRAGEAARASLEFEAAALDVITTGISLSAASEGSSIYAAFADASNVSLTMSSAAAFKGFITEARISVSHNPELIWEVGGTQAATYVPKEYEVEVELTALFNDPQAILDHIQAGELNALSIDVADATGAGSTLRFTVSGIKKITRLGLRQDIVEPAEITMTVTAQDISVLLV